MFTIGFISYSSVATRALFAGGFVSSNSKVIDYGNIESLANLTTFGNLTIARTGLASSGSSTRALFGGGTTGSNSNIIDYVTIASTGNAVDFGDLTVARTNLSATSTGHGGLQ